MCDAGELLEVGSIGRAHGTSGEVVVRLITNRTERLESGSKLAADVRELVVATSRPHQDRWLVRFEGVETRDQAEELRGWILRAPALRVANTLWVHELIGSTVREVSGTERGVVEAVVANPASDLLELDSGDLVPLTFVVEFVNGVVLIDVPDGLFDLRS
ncbi:MAG: 16S rRNA processing protein RimM [Acidimicrobiaceae bacterium]|nr:16S rRNA processing protein RimM [Acidimicrobiaceae bacterium]MCS5673466.1 ribosome maturation factor RimM [Acidimicrobiales bacterium]MEE2807349.1 ribosome maturation factor RimM [Actinomycetota bacterium]